MIESTGAVLETASSLSTLSLSGGWINYLIIIVIAAIWLTSMIRVARDVSARSENTGFQIVCILLVTFGTPLIGVPLYLLIRPVGRSYDMNGRRESILIKSVDCLHCGCKNMMSHRYCVFCGDPLKTQCKECDKEYPFYYEYCPACGAPHVKELVKRKKKT